MYDPLTQMRDKRESAYYAQKGQEQAMRDKREFAYYAQKGQEQAMRDKRESAFWAMKKLAKRVELTDRL